MTEITTVFENSAQGIAKQGSEPTKASKKRTSLSPLTLRLTVEERAKLEELAVGMTLSAYIRACVFNDEAKRRKRRPTSEIAEKKATAEVLALLGQSRIASNLNQLAYHANCGVLEIGKNERDQIAEANAYLADIRVLLMRALGSRP
ncbi:plasmid mobilization protein [Roseibium algae]|uniref:Mobilization protein MobC n=1 Tax=Roseibium algae TaxID=3123038 RepID=A0ABU8TRA7_9HYPH